MDDHPHRRIPHDRAFVAVFLLPKRLRFSDISKATTGRIGIFPFDVVRRCALSATKCYRVVRRTRRKGSLFFCAVQTVDLGPTPPSLNIRYSVAIGVKAEIEQTSPLSTLDL